ncbi:MAG: propanediol utilization protein [Bacteroidetes bacterium]|nr:MAG: propanediol utilization protein [Bacteroidota bacterium]
MKKYNFWLLTSSLFLLFGGALSLSGQTPLWKLTDPQRLTETAERKILPDQFSLFEADTLALQVLLHSAPPENLLTLGSSSGATIHLPTPTGELEAFEIVAYDLLEAPLQSQWWYIHTWRGVSKKDPTTTVRLDWTARGFHAMVLAPGGSWFIDPYFWESRTYYQSYFKKNYPIPTTPFFCGVEDEVPGDFPDEVATPKAGDCVFRQYRLALACTGEYAAFHGGTIAGAASGMATSMNRVNGVYETQLAMRLVLVGNNNDLIYLDVANDPYTNNDGLIMLGENQTTCDAVIGSANYDIGHVFSTGGGGIASLRSPCTSSRKAQGVTGSLAPVGDPFDIDYVTHEMGHQFGGNHTQNNDCNRAGLAAKEPGSASTIMGYAGICMPNVQNRSDPYYHGYSIQEIADYMQTGSGGACATVISSTNSAPTITTAVSDSYTIPGATPFLLTAAASDPNGHALLYCWEQFDSEVGEAMPPLATNTQGPVFRSFSFTSNPGRYFPNLPNLVNNVDPTWETLPATTRGLTFRATVLDVNSSSTYGCTTEDDVMMAVDGTTGPFLVTVPNTNLTWTEGESETVTWDVAGTTGSPVSCSLVDILLSYDGGFTYPGVLATQTANDGSATIIVPVGTTTTARVMVRSVNNVFFDISNANFTIVAPVVAGYSASYSSGSQVVCAGSSGSLDYVVNTSSFLGYSDDINLSATSMPSGTSVSFSSNPIQPGFPVTVTVDNLGGLTVGNYSVMVQTSSTSGMQTVELPFEVLGIAPAAALGSPADNAFNQSIFTGFDWADVPAANGYLLEVATDVGFNNLVLTTSLAASQYLPPAGTLSGDTDYYWRVTSTNSNCGNGGVSAVRSFLTEGCYYYGKPSAAVVISDGAAADYEDLLTVADFGTVTDMQVIRLDVTHTYTGDLLFSLVAPDNTSISLFSSLCEDNNDVLLTFDDAAAALPGCPLNTDATVKPAQSLSSFDGKEMNGTWKLDFRDDFDADGGMLNSWGLKVCTNNFSVLPVEWLGFAARAADQAIVLDWQTANEENNEGFDVERRAENEASFVPIGWVDATKSPTPVNDYTFVDRQLKPGLTYYYRLRQLDYGGKSDYSEIRAAQLQGGTPLVELFPNPASRELNVRIWGVRVPVTARVIDNAGRVRLQEEWASPSASTIDVHTLPAGLYWLQLSTDTWQRMEKLILIK